MGDADVGVADAVVAPRHAMTGATCRIRNTFQIPRRTRALKRRAETRDPRKGDPHKAGRRKKDRKTDRKAGRRAGRKGVIARRASLRLIAILLQPRRLRICRPSFFPANRWPSTRTARQQFRQHRQRLRLRLRLTTRLVTKYITTFCTKLCMNPCTTLPSRPRPPRSL